MGEHPARRGADLAGVGESSVRRGLRRAIEIGVLENQHRTIAAELEKHRLARAALGDAFARRGAAGKADAVGVGVRDDLVADGRTLADDEIDHALWQAGAFDRPHQRNRGHGCRRGRRPDDGVAGRNARSKIFDRYVDRIVPGRDHRIDAAGLAQGDHELRRVFGRQRLAAELFHELAREPEPIRGLGHLALRLRQRLALLGAQDPRDRLAALIDLGRDGDAKGGALPDRLGRPTRLSALGGGDGPARASPVAPGKPCDLLARRRIDGRHPLRVGLPGAVDEVAACFDRICGHNSPISETASWVDQEARRTPLFRSNRWMQLLGAESVSEAPGLRPLGSAQVALIIWAPTWTSR